MQIDVKVMVYVRILGKHPIYIYSLILRSSGVLHPVKKEFYQVVNHTMPCIPNKQYYSNELLFQSMHAMQSTSLMR